jgi:hypothetical protein
MKRNSDADLRDAERRWKATRSVEDHAAYLLALVRAGRTDMDKLRLLARMNSRERYAVELIQRGNAIETAPGWPSEGSDDRELWIGPWADGYDHDLELHIRDAMSTLLCFGIATTRYESQWDREAWGYRIIDTVTGTTVDWVGSGGAMLASLRRWNAKPEAFAGSSDFITRCDAWVVVLNAAIRIQEANKYMKDALNQREARHISRLREIIAVFESYKTCGAAGEDTPRNFYETCGAAGEDIEVMADVGSIAFAEVVKIPSRLVESVEDLDRLEARAVLGDEIRNEHANDLFSWPPQDIDIHPGKTSDDWYVTAHPPTDYQILTYCHYLVDCLRAWLRGGEQPKPKGRDYYTPPKKKPRRPPRRNSDNRLRGAERGGNRAEVLAWRVRYGVVPVDHMAVAAWLGDRDAAQVVEPWDEGDSRPLSVWLDGPVRQAIFYGPVSTQLVARAEADMAERTINLILDRHPAEAARIQRALDTVRGDWSAGEPSQDDLFNAMRQLHGPDFETGPVSMAAAAARHVLVDIAGVSDVVEGVVGDGSYSGIAVHIAIQAAGSILLDQSGLRGQSLEMIENVENAQRSEAEWQRSHLIGLLTGDIT